MNSQTIARATVEINRVHPDARDISVSSRGHEPIIRNTWANGATFHEINAWIASIAPEVNVDGAPSYANDPDQYSAFYFLPNAKDARGYSTYTYIRLYFAPVEEENNPMSVLDQPYALNREDAVNPIECRNCNGSGQILYRGTFTYEGHIGFCPACDGYGWVERCPEDTDDSSCMRDRLTCRWCASNGYLSRPSGFPRVHPKVTEEVTA